MFNMQSNIKIFAFLMLLALIAPNIALASWWNPFSWWSKKQVVQVTSVIQVATSTESANEKSKEGRRIQTEVKKPESKPVIKLKTKASIPVAPSPVVQEKTVQTIQTPISPSKVEVKVEKVSAYLPSIQAIDAFLANPSEQSLRDYCTRARTLTVPGEKKVLNESRTDYVTKAKTLYEGNRLCSKVMEEYLDILKRKLLINWFIYDDSYLVDFDNSNESDLVREFKINFNSYWKSLAGYKLIGISYLADKGNKTINEYTQDMVRRIIENPEGLPKTYLSRPEKHIEYIIPEKILSELKAEIMRNDRYE